MKKSEIQLKLQALLDHCQENLGWSRKDMAERLNMTQAGFSDNLHKERRTTIRTYYAVLGLIAEDRIEKLKKRKRKLD